MEKDLHYTLCLRRRARRVIERETRGSCRLLRGSLLPRLFSVANCACQGQRPSGTGSQTVAVAAARLVVEEVNFCLIRSTHEEACPAPFSCMYSRGCALRVSLSQGPFSAQHFLCAFSRSTVSGVNDRRIGRESDGETGSLLVLDGALYLHHRVRQTGTDLTIAFSLAKCASQGAGIPVRTRLRKSRIGRRGGWG